MKYEEERLQKLQAELLYNQAIAFSKTDPTAKLWQLERPMAKTNTPWSPYRGVFVYKFHLLSQNFDQAGPTDKIKADFQILVTEAPK